MQVTTEADAGTPSPRQIETGAPAEDAESSRLAADLYALVVYLHKNCTADLFEALGALDVTMSQTKLLQKLEHADGELTLKQAAEMLRLSLPAVSRAVDDLVRRGMVERHEDVEDRRMKRIELTDTGRAIISKLNGARLQGLEEFTQTLNDDERRALVGALTELLQRPDMAVCRPEGQLNP
jgi:DNA-binding MarR family transcriptional regulator